ncbi:hypothetical protein FOE78_03370 [Microlunatus elymi]|uniref:Sigma-70, region 4 n=1 Tax=Microlunatus elymi TaxID=2596828 RepID=A0A516PV92_9ACTN|nr:hypothetical protein [Microlunatus elymi]QDP95079.1 hypothetical protein FOE78_03370 [Microlunatus elymi]
MSSKSELTAIRDEPDPILRARQASALINEYQQQSLELARLRREAIEEAATTRGLTFTQVAKELGLSKGRITQIRQSAPPVERALFGMGPVTVAVPIRPVPDRDLGMIAAEDTRSAEAITEALRKLSLDVEHYEIPASGELDFDGDAVIICGPKSSAEAAELIAADPHFTFAPDRDGRWSIRETPTERTYESPLDNDPETHRDVAYLSVRTTDDSRRLLVAGVHAIGSLGAITYVINHLSELYQRSKMDANLSTVIETAFDGLTIREAERISGIRVWP